MSRKSGFEKETWHLNGFNMCEVIVIREGADARGHRYLDGRHQVRVALYEDMRAAADAVRQHNKSLSASLLDGSGQTKSADCSHSNEQSIQRLSLTIIGAATALYIDANAEYRGKNDEASVAALDELLLVANHVAGNEQSAQGLSRATGGDA